jgi:hypothetical protein
MKRKRSTSTRGVRMSDINYDLRYSVLVRLLVMNQVNNVFEVESVVPCFSKIYWNLQVC